MSHAPAGPRIALAHHWLMSMRGGEKTLLALARMFPEAPIYTLLARWSQLAPALLKNRVEVSWLQRLMWIPDLQRKALPVLSSAARSLDARGYDVVICSDAATIKAIRCSPDALKICYCHTPMRYVWDLYEEYYRNAGWAGRLGLRWCAPSLRQADCRAAADVTAFVANSREVAERISRCYGLPSVVIPPPVHTDFPEPLPAEGFYLVVGEQVGYKRTDLAIEACNRLGRRLVVIGTGPLLPKLRDRAGTTIRIMGYQSDGSVRDHLRRCRALLFCGREDFGLVPVEAQAAGRPVIAYRAGGAMESVLENRTGIFFNEQTPESLMEAIGRLERHANLWPPERIQAHARQFDTSRFTERFRRFYDWCLEHHRQGGPQAVRAAMQNVAVDSF